MKQIKNKPYFSRPPCSLVAKKHRVANYANNDPDPN